MLVLPFDSALPLFVLVFSRPGAAVLPWLECCVPAMPLPVAAWLEVAGDEVGLACVAVEPPLALL